LYNNYISFNLIKGVNKFIIFEKTKTAKNEVTICRIIL